MNRNMVLSAIAALLGAGFAASANAAEKAASKKQTTCPVMGGKITAKSSYVDVHGKRIYVCCAGCTEKIKADPDTYIKKLEAEGVTLEKSRDAKKADAQSDHSDRNH